MQILSATRIQIVLLGTLIYLNAVRALVGRVDGRFALLGAAFFVLLQSGYVYDKMICSREDRLNAASPAFGFNRSVRPLLLALLPASLYIISFAALRWIVILMAVVTPIYSLGGPGRFRLKAVPFLKPVLNTVLIFSVSVMPPVLLKYGTGWSVIFNAAASSWRLLVFIFTATVMLDIRDMSGDKAAGLMTFPVMLGAGTTAAMLGCGLDAAAFSGLKEGSPGTVALSLLIAAFLVPALWRRDRGYYELFLFALNVFAAGKWVLG